MEQRRQTILDALHAVRPEVNYEASSDFFTDGLLDSFDLVMLVTSLENSFSLAIDTNEIVPENFSNVDTIVNLLGKHQINDQTPPKLNDVKIKRLNN